MDEATFRILDTLSRKLGNAVSIRQLTSAIRLHHGTAYYAGTYNKLNDLTKQRLIRITKAGRSSVPALDLSSYTLLDLLSEMEMRRKREFLGRFKAFQPLLMDMEGYAHGDARIESVLLIDPERNARLNRAEVLIMTRDSHEVDSDGSIRAAARDAQGRHNIRVDALPVSAGDLVKMLASDGVHPLKKMLSNEIAFHNPHAFWTEIAHAFVRGYGMRFQDEEMDPRKTTESDLIFNLNRLGYREIGPRVSQGEKACPEYTVMSTLVKGGARRVNAIPVIMAKNEINYDLLVFLAQKYGLPDRLLGLLKAMHRIKPQEKVAAAIDVLEASGTKAIKADERAIGNSMRLYNAA